MTEEEWLSGSQFSKMYKAVGSISTRKVRLYMSACCRLELSSIPDPAIAIAVDTAEQIADDPNLETLLCEKQSQYFSSACKDRPLGALGKVIIDIWELVQDMPCPPDFDDDEMYSSEREAVAHAAFLSLRELPTKVFSGGSGDAAEACAHAIYKAAFQRTDPELRNSANDCRMPIADLLRDIFGNPFRPVTFDPRWRTSDVVGIARTIYEDRAFEQMPILADALMDAGCGDEQIIEHCRGTGPHVRGCWVVDLVLGTV